MHPDIEFLRVQLEHQVRERRSIERANRFRADLRSAPKTAGPVRRLLDATATAIRRARTQRSGRATRRRSETPPAGAPI
jgi:hypothetical protein